jgi:ubiquinone/menaquinone biosynthesis C-methylase UbiE
MLSPFRRFLKHLHPEGIPWPASVCYNLISGTGIFQRHYEVVARDIVSFCSNGRILDIGTGPGRLLVELYRQEPVLQLAGIDISPAMVMKARHNAERAGLAETIDFREGSADTLPFDDATFDVVVSTGSIHHWKHPGSGLNEIYRVLKPGGYALLYDIVSDTPKSVMQQAAREFGRFKMFMLWLHAFEEPFYNTEEFAKLPHPTSFNTGQIRFVGVLCCLQLIR